jgi:hypothetical protein
MKALYSEMIQRKLEVSEVFFPPGLYLRIADQNAVSRRSHLKCEVQRGCYQRRLSDIQFQTTCSFDLYCDHQH